VNLNYDVSLYSQVDSIMRKSLICLLNPRGRTCGTFTSPSRDNHKSTVSNLFFTPGYFQLKNNGDSGNGPCRLSLSYLDEEAGLCATYTLYLNFLAAVVLIYFSHACSFVQFASPQYECRTKLRTLIAQKVHVTMDKILT
jgi:hypothetical protein